MAELREEVVQLRKELKEEKEKNNILMEEFSSFKIKVG